MQVKDMCLLLAADDFSLLKDCDHLCFTEACWFLPVWRERIRIILTIGKVQVGKDQEKAQSERDSHSKNRGGKKTN